MPKTTTPLLVEDFYIATSTLDIPATGDITIVVNTPPTNTKGFLIVDPNSQANRERMYYHNVIGNTIYVRGVNRIDPKQHYAQDKVQINDTSLIFNYLSKLQSTTFYVEQTALLEVKIWGGPVLVGINTISVEDTTLAMTNTATNYIYYKTTTNEIKTTTVEANATTDKGIIVAEVTAVAGSITTINYRHHELMSGNTIDSIVLTSTAGLVDTYTITYTDGTTSTFNITNGNGIASIALFATSPDGLTKTYKITFTNGNTFNYDVLDGNAITSVDYTSSTPNGLIDTYTITFQDGTSTTFNITNGNAITSVAYTSSTPDGLVDTYTINFQDGTSTTFDVTNGNSIVSVNYTSSLGLVDTYTITFQDGTTTTFEITNGADGVSVWGSITGTLADQTDLINALNAKLSLAGGSMTGLLQEAKSADIASATTTNLATATGNTVHITGTTTITGFGTLQAGAKFTLIFDGILTLTHNATSLILPTGADIVTAVGDSMEIVSEGSGNWRVIDYQRKDGSPLVGVAPNAILLQSLTAGENMNAGQPYRKGLGVVQYIGQPTAPVQAGDGYIGNSTTLYEAGQGITPTLTGLIYELEVLLRSIGSPVFTGNIELFSNSACTNLIGTSETKSLINGTNNFLFTTPISVTNGTPFYFKINLVTGTVSSSNCFALDSTSASVYSGGNAFSITNANVITQKTSDFYFKINKTFTSGLNEDINKKYIAKAISTLTNRVQGLVNTNVLANGTFNGNIGGLQTGLSSLTEGEVYYLSDAGGLSLSSGTTSVKVGRAISETQINFVPPL